MNTNNTNSATETIEDSSRYFEKLESKPPLPTPKPIKKSWIFLRYSHIGTYIALPIFLSLTFGLFLDNLFAVKPLFTLVLLFLGSCASIYNIYKILKEEIQEHAPH